jgi:hypothetical protein
MNILNDLFGAGGLAKGVVDILKGTGIIKDPAVEAQIKTAMLDYEAKIQAQAVELEKISADDRASARSREIAVRDKTPTVLATVSVIGFFAILVVLVFVQLPKEAQPLLILIGYLGANVQQVYNYYFGSSSGSSSKTDMLKDLMQKNKG